MSTTAVVQLESSAQSTDQLANEVFQAMQSSRGLKPGSQKSKEFVERLTEQSRSGETNPLSFVMTLLVMYNDCLTSKCDHYEAQALADSYPVNKFVC